MIFRVIDNRTGKEPIYDHNHLFKEKWFKESALIYCDISGWGIDEDGYLFLIDDCNNMAYPPSDRYSVIFDSEELKKRFNIKTDRDNMTLEDLENSFICGYRVKDLILFGKLFHDNGIKREDLTKYSEAYLDGYKRAYDEINAAIQKTVDSIISNEEV